MATEEVKKRFQDRLRRNNEPVFDPAIYEYLRDNPRVMPYITPTHNLAQVTVIGDGLKAGVDVKKYNDIEYNWMQMNAILQGLKKGIDPTPYLTDNRNDLIIGEVVRAIGEGLKPEQIKTVQRMHKWQQAREVRIGFRNGIDATKYADPSLQPREMRETRIKLEDEKVIKKKAEYERKPSIQQKRYYTGSPNKGIKTFVAGGDGSTKTSGDSYGRGVYLTDNVEVARLYAGDRGKVYTVEINHNLLNLSEKANEAFLSNVIEVADNNIEYRNRLVKMLGYTEETFSIKDRELAEEFYDLKESEWAKNDGIYKANMPQVDSKNNAFIIAYKDYSANLKLELQGMTNKSIFEALGAINTNTATSLVIASGFDGIAYKDDGAFNAGIKGTTVVIYRKTQNIEIIDEEDMENE